MKLKWQLISLMLMLALAACSPSNEVAQPAVPTAQPEPADADRDNHINDAESDNDALDTAHQDDVDSAEMKDPATDSTVLDPARVSADPIATEAPEPMPESPTDSQVVKPGGSVNLGELTPVPPVDKEPREMPAPGIPGPGPVPLLLEAVITDLSVRLGIAPSAITHIATQEVVWNNSGLGCPQEGYAYLDVLTPGFLIELAVNSQPYNYHASGNGHWVLCVEGKALDTGSVTLPGGPVQGGPAPSDT